MAAPRKRPIPPARMVELLGEAKRRLIRSQGMVTAQDFDREWDAAWALMVAEKAWPHNTGHRRTWRQAMLDTKDEMRSCFLDEETAYSRWRDQAEFSNTEDFADPAMIVGSAVA